MRRIPYIDVKDNKLRYMCPHCLSVIPRDLYRALDYCSVCGKSINRTAKTIMKVYRAVDLEFYDYFIKVIKEEKERMRL